MLTIRENLLETIRGGKPDRFVNQYEYMELVLRSAEGLDIGCGGDGRVAKMP